MSSRTVYLVTGASRGLGKGFVEAYLALPNNTVIAAVRDTFSAQSQSLKSLPVGENSSLVIVKIDSSSHTDALKAIASLKSAHNITHIDVVIANAGISNDASPIETATVDSVQEHINVNAIGPYLLFQATFELLKKAKQRKFVVIGSALGSIGYMEQRAAHGLFAYGASKAMAHWTSRRIHFSHENIISFVVDPEFVQTDMGNHGAQLAGMEKAFTEIDECISEMVPIIDITTREKTSGTFQTWDGSNFGF